MVSIPDKTLEDLEYNEVLKHCSAFSITPMGKEVVLSLRPLNKADEVLNRLKMTSEYCSSFDNENRIPNHEFDNISSYFQLLKIENSVLELEAFRNLARNTETSNALVRFLDKFKKYYPNLSNLSRELFEEKQIKTAVDSVIMVIDCANGVEAQTEKLMEVCRMRAVSYTHLTLPTKA